MSAEQTAGGTAAPEAAPRRKRPSRPPTVALSEFGKAPPPPPRIKMTPRQIATYTVIGLAVVIVVWIGSVQVGQFADSYWSRAGNIDQRNR